MEMEEPYDDDLQDIQDEEADANAAAANGDDTFAVIDDAAKKGNKAIAKADRTTTPYMTKYERARILGTRALQIRYALR